MDISFPIQIVWRRTNPGVQKPLAVDIDGKRCLAAFEDDGKRFQFYMEHDIQEEQIDRVEAVDATMLAAFVNGVSFSFVVVNPGCDDQRVYGAEHFT